uniref:UDP-N-acetylglucosamine transporter n=1 Tax=Ditylenchus dipsaci TaxID=166011 RepID=A0A915CVW2_9BILA
MSTSSSLASALFSSDEFSGEMWTNSSTNSTTEWRSKKSSDGELAEAMLVKNKWLKWISLLVLVVQASALVLVLRYSRMPVKKTVELQKVEEIESFTKRPIPDNTNKVRKDEPRYLSSTAVVLAEVIKFSTCLFVLFVNNKFSCRRFTWEIDTDIFKKGKDTLKIGIPALLYVVQNNLLFLALSKLDAATYQVTSQLKILTTVAFSMLMLDKKLTKIKWISLVMLTAGVALVQLPADSASSFARKGDSVVLHANIQLSFFGIFGGLFMTWLYDREAVRNHGFFQGYYWLVWVVVLLQAYGGLTIALVMKYADNILKGFAVSLSIVVSCFISWFFLNDFVPTYAFLIGATIVVVSTFLYGYEPKKAESEHHV